MALFQLTEEVKYTFKFEFSVTIDKATGASVDISFKPLSQKSTIDCTPNTDCKAKADTILKWCTDLTCTSNATPDLHQNDQFVLQLIVITAGMDYYLIGTEVLYIGNGLNKKATPVQVINTTKGQVIILLKAEIVWSQVTIKVASALSTTQAGNGYSSESCSITSSFSKQFRYIFLTLLLELTI